MIQELCSLTILTPLLILYFGFLISILALPILLAILLIKKIKK